ncbi:glycosyltransferase family 87 protein [Gymnodinialimonas sp. 2305UL16-5]|uniref:glycosyltransferase family 87 protein n=1 Tax=Gymnodinialimonas mytili TaxID=3126503 RepID=UPI0030984AE5
MSHGQDPSMLRPWAIPPVLAWGFAALCAALAAAYMGRTFMGNLAPKDFSYFWIAGQIWLEGGNPYLSSFSDIGNDLAATTPGMEGLGGFHRWLYAPHIWGLSTGIGIMDYTPARILWGVGSTIAILWGTYLGLAAVQRPDEPTFWVGYGALSLLAAVTIGTATSISTGQLSPLIYTAAAAFAYGVLRSRGWVVGIALIVLTLKPSFALPFVAFALAARPLRLPTLNAAGIALVLSLPVFLSTPLSELVAGYLDGLGAYGTYGANIPPSLTGATNLLHAGLRLELSGLVYGGLAGLVGVALGLLAGQGDVRARLAVLLAATLLLVPLHLYDLTLLVLLVPLMSGVIWKVAAVLANLAMLRVNRISDIIGMTDTASGFPGSFLASLILLLVLIGALMYWGFSRRADPNGKAQAR